ncbi:unnamed protein product [Tenebrio molitor]|nr:unnamed protein product [Tenebrio molitor]
MNSTPLFLIRLPRRDVRRRSSGTDVHDLIHPLRTIRISSSRK